jgi:hypothetical protein
MLAVAEIIKHRAEQAAALLRRVEQMMHEEGRGGLPVRAGDTGDGERDLAGWPFKAPPPPAPGRCASAHMNPGNGTSVRRSLLGDDRSRAELNGLRNEAWPSACVPRMATKAMPGPALRES